MTGVEIQVLGTDAAVAFLKNQDARFKQAVALAMAQAGLALEAEVKLSIAGQRDETRSVDTGRLMNSVESAYNETAAKVYTTVEYAEYIEEGTTKIPARKHFRNSAERKRDDIRRYVADEINKASK